jgi:hypothetical protein
VKAKFAAARANGDPGGFRDAAVFHPRGTRGFASAAHEAEIEVPGEPFIEIDAAFRGGTHQMNPSTGRFGLDMKRSVSRTGIETEPAMNALVKFGNIERRFRHETLRGLCHVAALFLYYF